MLDVIGAGATATSSVDWHEKWLHSSEAVQVQQQLDELHSEGRKRPAVQASIQSDFATSWAFQLITLIGRGFTSYWRNPYYLLAKLVLNIVAGLLVGFTFFKANSSIQGTQDKLFVSVSLYMFSIPCWSDNHRCFRRSLWLPSFVFPSPISYKSFSLKLEGSTKFASDHHRCTAGLLSLLHS